MKHVNNKVLNIMYGNSSEKFYVTPAQTVVELSVEFKVADAFENIGVELRHEISWFIRNRAHSLKKLT